MANPEHVAILNRAVDEWNTWREENPGETPDLRGADLHRANLGEANLREANLLGANLAGANLLNADLSGAIPRVHSYAKSAIRPNGRAKSRIVGYPRRARGDDLGPTWRGETAIVVLSATRREP